MNKEWLTEELKRAIVSNELSLEEKLEIIYLAGYKDGKFDTERIFLNNISLSHYLV